MKSKEQLFTFITISLALFVSSMLFFGPYLQPLTSFFKSTLKVYDDKTLFFYIMALGNLMMLVSVFIISRVSKVLEVKNLQRTIHKPALNLPLLFFTFSNVLCAYISEVGEEVMLNMVVCLAAKYTLYFYFTIISSILTVYVESLIFFFNLLLLVTTFLQGYEKFGTVWQHVFKTF
ncbi:hypothetical protein VCUG_02129 [Vavraia culicis subsp. floridensis]|uniref:Uncharacterized protein n=1 Tax=Vavraia culicis (isolate floridensis) TaxID=948595 RepID=L2GTF4_VAVCU|nr:uncharacterized protein VCUG_02129 [Vavraia culicis subsp. floridensis]ELA46365.1 hypothetical protein VCUG_02129 [Vavraia culicis subsp. floridensis]